MALKNDMGLKDYVNLVNRNLSYVIVFFLVAFVTSVAYALYIPSVYESNGKILIESKIVQANDAKAKFALDRFETLKTVVMTNENMIRLARRYQLFNLEKFPILSSDTEAVIAKLMRTNIKVELMQADVGDWQKSTFAFQVTSQANSAKNAYGIATDIINMFMSENAQSSQEQANESAAFFGKAAEAKKAALETIESEITAYKRSHVNALPQNASIQATSLDRLESDLRMVQREQSGVETELRALEMNLDAAKAGLDANGVDVEDKNESELDKLNVELTKLSGIYNDNHPAIMALKRKIEALEQQEAKIAPAKPKLDRNSAAQVARLQSQIIVSKGRIKGLEREQAEIRAKISRTEGNVIETAQSEGVLGALERRYDTAKAEYAEAKSKQDNAKLEKNIQLENKGERFVLLESPKLSTNPVKPNRLLLMLLGFFASIAGALGIAILIEMFDGKVRGVESIASIIKLQPMAVIPFIKNEADAIQVRYKFYNLAYIVFSLVVLALIIIHFFIMPLDQVSSKMYSGF